MIGDEWLLIGKRKLREKKGVFTSQSGMIIWGGGESHQKKNQTEESASKILRKVAEKPLALLQKKGPGSQGNKRERGASAGEGKISVPCL